MPQLPAALALLFLMSAILPASATAQFEEVDGRVAVEAEHFHQATRNRAPRDWFPHTVDKTPDIKPDPDGNHSESASGKSYLELLPDTRVTHDDPLKRGESFFDPGQGPALAYQVYFNTPGTYIVWVRGFSTGTEDNGIHVGINGTWPKSGAKLQFCKGKNQWTWSSNQRDSGGKPCGKPGTVRITVPKKGLHVIMFSAREDGFEFDKWYLTTDPDDEPQGEGLAERLKDGQATTDKK